MTRSISQQVLTEELVRRGFLAAGIDTQAPAGAGRPWFISIVLGFSGWLAGAFSLVFVALLFKPDTPAGFALSGVILLAAAFGLYAADRDSQFFDQLALALSIAGQFALTWAAGDATDSAAVTAALVAFLQIALLFAMPNDLAKVLAAFFACCAWALAIRFAWWGEPSFGVDRESVSLAPALLGWLLVWAPIIALAHILVTTEHAWMAKSLRSTARPALTGLLVSLCVATWISEPLASLEFWDADGDGKTNWLVLWPLLGAATASFAAFCAFRLLNRALIGVAVIGALLHLAQFYYLLGTTLLIKAGIMVVVGIVALLAAAWLRNPPPSKTGSAS